MIAAPSGHAPRVTVLRDRYVARDAARGVVVAPLGAALLRHHPTDAHFQQGYTESAAVQRMTRAAIETDGAMMTCIAFDLDGPQHVATQEWRTETRAKIAAVLAAYPGGFSYETRNGFRLLWTIEPILLASAADAKEWVRCYTEVCDTFAARFGLQCDRSCSDPARLFRLPFVVRAAGKAPEALPTVGDANSIGMFPL